MFIAIGLSLYSLRRIRIMRAIGTLKNDDAFRVVLKRVNSLTLDYKEDRMSVVGAPMSTQGNVIESQSIVMDQMSLPDVDEDFEEDEVSGKKKKPVRILGERSKKETAGFGDSRY